MNSRSLFSVDDLLFVCPENVLYGFKRTKINYRYKHKKKKKHCPCVFAVKNSKGYDSQQIKVDVQLYIFSIFFHILAFQVLSSLFFFNDNNTPALNKMDSQSDKVILFLILSLIF